MPPSAFITTFLEGKAPRSARMFVARGAAPVPPAELLHLLVRTHPRVVAKSAIEDAIWENDMTESAYRNLVNKLRRKLGQDSIQTLPGIGIRVVLQ